MSTRSVSTFLYKHSKRLTRGIVGVLLRSLTLTYSGLLITGIIGTTVQSLIKHQLSPVSYGEFSLLLTTLSFIALLIGIGFDAWILKEGANHPDHIADIVWQVLLLKGIGLVLVLLAISMSLIGQAHYGPAFFFGLIGIACTSFVQTGYAVLRVYQRNGQVALYQIIEIAIVMAALLVTQFSTLTVTMLMMMRFGATLLISIILGRQIIRLCGPFHPHLNPLRALHGVWPYMISDSLATLYSQMPILILGTFAGIAAVGMFQPALDIVILTYTIPNLAFFIILPLLSQHTIGRDDFIRLVQLFIAGSLLFGVSTLLGINIFGKRMIEVLSGTAYTESYRYLILLSFIPFLKAGSFIAVSVILACNKVRSRILVQAIASVVCAILGFLIIPSYGILGIVIVIIVVEILLFVLYTAVGYYGYRQRFSQRLHEDHTLI